MKTIRLTLYFVVGLLLGTLSAFSYAGSYQSYQGSAFRNINGTTYWKGDAGTLSNSKATVLEGVKVGGTYITVPTFGQITGAAIGAGMAVVRMSPGLAGLAVSSWLIEQGLEQISGEWKKKKKATNDVPEGSGNVTCDNVGTGVYKGGNTYTRVPSAAHCGGSYPAGSNVISYCYTGGSSCAFDALITTPGCPTGTTLQNGGCVANTDYVPAGQSDWDAVNGIPKPDEVLRELCQTLAKYGSTTPGCAVNQAKTEKAAVPLSDWKTDPATGIKTRDVATWTPAPTAEDPFRGEVSIQEEKLTPTTTTNPETGQPETTETPSSTDKTKETPLCTLYPDIIACKTFGEAEDPAKLDDTKQVSITPDSGFGPSDGQCPQDLTHTVKLTGTQVRFSYQPVCTGIRTFRPVIIGMAWISGVLIFLGITRKAQG